VCEDAGSGRDQEGEPDAGASGLQWIDDGNMGVGS
jgi:hypothetical protein